MATTFYCDLSLSSATGNSGLDAGHPWAWDDFNTYILTHLIHPDDDGNTLLLKGQKDVPEPKILNFWIFDAWDSTSWNLRMDGNTIGYSGFGNTTLKHGTLYFYNVVFSAKTVGPCYSATVINETAGNSLNFVAGDWDVYHLPSIYEYKGSIFKADHLAMDDGISFTDCILDGSINAPSGCNPTPTAHNCAFTMAQPGPTYITPTNCQFSWTPPTWPAWNADKEDWAEATLATGITTPPEPGNSPYTGYETDPWGNARDGIGAFYMEPLGPTPPVITVQPSSLTKIVGQSASFFVTATGTDLHYFWEKDESSVGTDSSVFSIGSVSISDAGSYEVDVTNAGGEADSSAAILTVLAPASISIPPVSLTKIVGQGATFSVDATGTLPLTYTWTKADSTVGADYTYSIASVSTGDAGTYRITVDNTCSSPVHADATLTVLIPAAITVQPISLTKLVGQDATFSVTASGTAPLNYQWKKDSTSIGGATSSDYIISSVAMASAGSYKVTVDNTCSTPVDSSSVILTVHVPPTILTQPASQRVAVEQPVTFSVDATGNLPISYQWKKDSTSISGATSFSFTIAETATTDAGSYAVHLSNSYGTADSSAAILTIGALPPPTPVEITKLGSVFASSVNATPFSPSNGTTQLFLIDGQDLPGGVLQQDGFIKYAVTGLAGETYHTQIHVDMLLQASNDGVAWYDIKKWGITAHENQVGRVHYNLHPYAPRFLQVTAKVLGDSNTSVSVIMGMEAYSI